MFNFINYHIMKIHIYIFVKIVCVSVYIIYSVQQK